MFKVWGFGFELSGSRSRVVLGFRVSGLGFRGNSEPETPKPEEGS